MLGSCYANTTTTTSVLLQPPFLIIYVYDLCDTPFYCLHTLPSKFYSRFRLTLYTLEHENSEVTSGVSQPQRCSQRSHALLFCEHAAADVRSSRMQTAGRSYGDRHRACRHAAQAARPSQAYCWRLALACFPIREAEAPARCPAKVD